MQIIQERDLSPKTKEFISKFKRIDQQQMDDIEDTVRNQREPVTIKQVEYIMR